MTTQTDSNTNHAAATTVAVFGMFAVGMVMPAFMAPVNRKRGYYASVLTRS